METNINQQVAPAPQKVNSPVLLIVLITIIVVAILVGVYWFMSIQRTSDTARSYPVGQQPAQAQTLEQELNAIEIESNDADFVDVDRDLQSL